MTCKSQGFTQQDFAIFYKFLMANNSIKESNDWSLNVFCQTTKLAFCLAFCGSCTADQFGNCSFYLKLMKVVV